MINKLRKKFVLFSLLSVSIVLIAMVVIINAINFINVNNSANNIMNILIDNGGYFPKPTASEPKEHKKDRPLSDEAPYENRYFTVVMDSTDGEVVMINTGNIAAVNTSEALIYAKGVFSSQKKDGYVGIYKYKVSEQDNNRTLIVFLDCSKNINTCKSFLITSLLVLLASIISVFVLALLLSKTAVKPIVESYTKQKQFITNASHELKTPVTIIGANTDIIEMESGASEWTQSIKNQIERLTALTQNLIDLSRMNEENIKLTIATISLSGLIDEAVSTFTPVAQSQDKSIIKNVQKDIFYNGDAKLLKNLLSILMDNAIKYSSDYSEIFVSLKKEKNNISLVVSNFSDEIDRNDTKMIFERFYRGDASRNSDSGGYGIGLATAKAIVEAHKGKIWATTSEQNSKIFLSIVVAF